MTTLAGISSAQVLPHLSWVRKQAQALVRHLPANVERSDLIQVGMLAIAQSAVSFEWEGDRDTDAAQEAFVRYARMRVKGAMLDELRQMDFLSRGERRGVKRINAARERHLSQFGADASRAQIAYDTGMDADEIGALMLADSLGRNQVDVDEADGAPWLAPASDADQVENAVDRRCVLARLERAFGELSARDSLIVDAYMGLGQTPIEVAAAFGITPSRVSQIFTGIVRKVTYALREPEPPHFVELSADDVDLPPPAERVEPPAVASSPRRPAVTTESDADLRSRILLEMAAATSMAEG